MTHPHFGLAHEGFRVPARQPFLKGLVVKMQFMFPAVSAAVTESRTRELIDEVCFLLKIEEVLIPVAFGKRLEGIDQDSANDFLDDASPFLKVLRETRELVRKGKRLDHLEQMMLTVAVADLWQLSDPLLRRLP